MREEVALKINLPESRVQVQPDRLKMAMLFWYLVKSDASVNYCTVLCIGQVKLSRYQKHTAMETF